MTLTTHAVLDGMGALVRPTSANVTGVLAMLSATRIRHARVIADSANLAALKQMAAAGIKLLLIQDGTASLDLAKQIGRASVWGVEGPNEINNDTARFRDGALVGWDAVEAMTKQTWAEAQAWDPTLPVLTPSQSCGAPTLGHSMLATATWGNVHCYMSAGAPSAWGMPEMIAAQAGVNAPGAPYCITETGYSRVQPGGVTPAAQAVLGLIAVLDGLRLGAARVYLYQLADQVCDAGQFEDNFGLFGLLAAGATYATPLAHAVGNMMAILSDYGAMPVVDPRPPTVQWAGLGPDCVMMPLAGPHGDWFFAVWREQAATAKLVPDQVTLNVPVAGLITVYDPCRGTGYIQNPVSGTQVVTSLGAEPLLLRYMPGAT